MSEPAIVNRHINSNIFFEFQGYTHSVARSEAWLEQAYQLRAEIFCNELKWVGTANQTRETDYFDNHAAHIGVLSCSAELIAYLRVHPPRAPWMADSIFSDYFPTKEPIRQQDTCEVSRLTVRNGYRSGYSSTQITPTNLIYQLLYSYCRLIGTERGCMIVSKPVLHLLKHNGLPCKAPGLNRASKLFC